VAFSPDGSLIVSASWDYTFKLWGVQSGQELQTFKGHLNAVIAVAFSPDRTMIVSASADKTIKLWDVQLGKELRTLEGHTDSVRAVAFSPDGTVVASASNDKTVKLWNTQSGHNWQTLKGHNNTVSAVAFSPDGSLVVSASWDYTFKLWGVQSGQERQTFKVDVIVRDLSFSSDASCLHTDRGVLNIPSGTASATPHFLTPSALFIKNQWLVRDSESLLWLPPEYRAGSVAVLGDIVIFGHASGCVLIMEFTS
jgi:WD40 repeat protein